MAEVVSNSREDWAPRLKSCSKGLFCLVLVAALLFAAISIVAFSKYGNMGLVAAGVATLVCLVPVCSALLVTGLAVGTPQALNGILLGVFVRTAVPFLLSILLTQAIRPLADAGLFAMVVINFLVLLPVETAVLVRLVQTYTSTIYQ